MLKDSLSQRKFHSPHPQPGTHIFIVAFLSNLIHYKPKFMWCLSLTYSNRKILFGGFCVSKYDRVLGCLFRDECYHIPEFINDRRRGHGPQGIQEEFNYRHSSLRGVVERTFGVLKNTWKIFDYRMPQMSLE